MLRACCPMRSTRPARWMSRIIAHGKSKLTTMAQFWRFCPSLWTSVATRTRNSSPGLTLSRFSLLTGLNRHASAVGSSACPVVLYFFDDVHISQADLMQVRIAAERHIDESLVPTDRAAIFTTSGRTTLDFTDDRAKLHATLLRLSPQPIARAMSQLCPDISYYQADLIFNQNDPMALQ